MLVVVRWRRSGHRSCSVYEIDGRLLVRTVDRSDGLGIERDETTVLDGFPSVAAAVVGAAVVRALDETREIPRPTSWPRRGEYAQSLLAASPGRHRSFRSWQRVARHVSVNAQTNRIDVSRWHPDLSRGSWLPAEDGWPQEITLPASASAGEIGAAVLEALLRSGG